jgi:hypothetical protein
MLGGIEKLLAPFFFSLPIILAAPTSDIARRDDFKWAVIGDSWAAGAGIKKQDLYDDTACRRSNESWGVLMSKDKTWTDNAQDFTFAPCSGAWLESTYEEDTVHSEDPTPQLKNVGSPDLLTMIAGGNNCKFAPIAEACIFLTRSVAERKTCDEAFADAQTYVDSNDPNDGKSFSHDHTRALTQIMSWPTIHGNDNFRLYIMGYAKFFTESPDSDWCNDISFSPLNIKLDKAKRDRMNAMVKQVNGLIQTSITNFNNPKVQFVPIDDLFEGHRFCRKGDTKNDQFYSNDVWFWNLNNPADDPDYVDVLDFLPGVAPILDAVKLANQQMWANNFMFPNGTVPDEQGIINLMGLGGIRTARIFHPKLGGNSAMKDTLLARLRSDKVPGVKDPAPPPPPPKQPYASGDIHFHVNEYWDCLPDENNLSVEIAMWDSTAPTDSHQIGYMARTQAGATQSAQMGSKLEDQLIITPEHQGDYIQFQLGDLHFKSTDEQDTTQPKKAWCKIGGWDPRGGPTCLTLPVPFRGTSVSNSSVVHDRILMVYFRKINWSVTLTR